jgi:DNA-binding MarR family transcriptional regulator
VIHEALDLEARTNGGDHLSLRLWLRLLSCTNAIETRARAMLRREFETTLPRFDLMAQLERAPDGLKMSELSRRLMVTGGNVTRLTDQLESEGLVARADAADRRVYRVSLTPRGRHEFAAMAKRHEEWIVASFAALSHEERTQLYSLLAKLKHAQAALAENEA